MGDTLDSAVWAVARKLDVLIDLERRHVEALELRNKIHLLEIVASDKRGGGVGEYKVWGAHALELYRMLDA